MNPKLLVILAILALPAGLLAAEEPAQTQSAPAESAKEKSAPPEKKAETAKEDEEIDESDFRVIEPKREQKNTTTMAAPPGVQETNERRHKTYTKISKRAKDNVNQERTAEQKAEDAKLDAETQPPPEESTQKSSGKSSDKSTNQDPPNP